MKLLILLATGGHRGWYWSHVELVILIILIGLIGGMVESERDFLELWMLVIVVRIGYKVNTYTMGVLGNFEGSCSASLI